MVLISIKLHHTIKILWKKMRRLIDFKNVKQRSRPIIEIIPMVFDNSQATQRIVLHHLKRVIHQHRDELQKLAYK